MADRDTDTADDRIRGEVHRVAELRDDPTVRAWLLVVATRGNIAGRPRLASGPEGMAAGNSTGRRPTRRRSSR
jgi:hypothetical protein